MCEEQGRGELAVAKMSIADAYVVFILPALRRNAALGLPVPTGALESLDFYKRALKLKKIHARTQIPKHVPEAPHADLLWEPPSLAEFEAQVAPVVADYDSRGVHDPSYREELKDNEEATDELMALFRNSPDGFGLEANWFYNEADLATMHDHVPESFRGRMTRQCLAAGQGYAAGGDADSPDKSDNLPLSIISGLSLSPRFVMRAVMLADRKLPKVEVCPLNRAID